VYCSQAVLLSRCSCHRLTSFTTTVDGPISANLGMGTIFGSEGDDHGRGVLCRGDRNEGTIHPKALFYAKLPRSLSIHLGQLNANACVGADPKSSGHGGCVLFFGYVRVERRPQASTIGVSASPFVYFSHSRLHSPAPGVGVSGS